MGRRNRDEIPPDADPKLYASEWRDQMARDLESVPGIARRRTRARCGSDLGHVGDDMVLFEVLCGLVLAGPTPGPDEWKAFDRRVRLCLGWKTVRRKPKDGG